MRSVPAQAPQGPALRHCPERTRWCFIPAAPAKSSRTYVPALLFLWRLTRLRHRLEKDPAARHYSDIAITPLQDELTDTLALFEATDAARAVAARARVRAATIHPVAGGRKSDPPLLDKSAASN